MGRSLKEVVWVNLGVGFMGISLGGFMGKYWGGGLYVDPIYQYLDID